MFSLPPGQRTDKALQRSIPLGLLGLSFVLAVVSRDLLPQGAWPWVIGLSLLVAGYHLSDPSSYSPTYRQTAWLVSALPTFALVSLSPFFAFYAASLVLAASVISAGRTLWPFLLPGALAVSLGQIGGLPNLRQAWPVYLVLVVGNIGAYSAFIGFGHLQDRNLAERDAALKELEQAQAEKAVLQARLVEQAHTEGVLQERARLAREIHDTVAQGLVGIITQLQSIDGTEAPESRAERLARAEGSARESLAEVRRAVQALASPRLDRDDLPAALTRLIDDWSARSTVPVTVRIVGEQGGERDDAALLRICQEALSNVARHAQARSVDVELSHAASGISLVVSDDGRGFAAGGAVGHGISGMRQRAQHAGGTLEIVTAPGEGTTVRALLPYARTVADPAAHPVGVPA